MSDEHQLTQRLQFMQFGPRDAELARASLPILKEAVGRALDAFYDHVAATPAVSQRFSSRQHVEKTKASQAAH